MTVKPQGVPLTNKYVQQTISSALKIVEKGIYSERDKNDDAPMVVMAFLHSTLLLVKLYSSSSNGIPALRGLGLDESLAIAEKIVAAGTVVAKDFALDHKSIALGIRVKDQQS